MSNPGWDSESQIASGLSSHNRPVYPEYAPNPQPDWIEPKYFADQEFFVISNRAPGPMRASPERSRREPAFPRHRHNSCRNSLPRLSKRPRCIGPLPRSHSHISHSDLLDRVPRQRA
jgi:hypothetical protein